MSNVSAWSVTAGSNNSSPPNGWPEGMARSAVNDCAREMMAALAKWYKDGQGSLTTAGGTTAYTLTTNSVYTTLASIPLLAVSANVTNTGPSTLAVDGLTAKSLVKRGGNALASGDFKTNQIHVIVYNAPTDRFELVTSALGDGFIAATNMVFQQTAAPTGWTKQVALTDKALRLTSGTASTGGAGGTFSSVFTSRTITTGNLPNPSLPFTLNAANHQHGPGTYAVGTGITNGTLVARNIGTTNVTAGGVSVLSSFVSATLSLASGAVSGSSDLSGALSVSGSITLGGSGTAMDFAVQYVDVIIAAKN